MDRFTTGEYLAYYEDGSLRRKGQYRNGDMVGEWVFYDRDGQQTTIRYD